ncbi:MAG: TrkA family potassium uptake protein [Clostridia bacterium]|nr:TrkA family potassium uptake protein [Clostridia bacterium]
MSKKKFLVIGLGRFGRSLVATLAQLDAEVMAVDKSAKAIAAIELEGYCQTAMELDSTSKAALLECDIPQFEAVCICIANEQTSIMTALLCVELGAQRVVAKAQSDMQGQVLYKLGVDQVVYPERDAGAALAHKLISSDILQSIALSDDYSTAEFSAPPEWIGKTLVELEFRGRYGLSVIGIRRGDSDLNINPLPSDPIAIEDRIYVVGSIENIRKVEKMLSRRSRR